MFNIDERTIITSDTHLGDRSILQFCRGRRRYLRRGETHEEYMSRVVWGENRGKTILHLGDFNFRGSSPYHSVISNTNTFLIPGNHDKKKREHYIVAGGMKNVINGVYMLYNGVTTLINGTDKVPHLNGLIANVSGKKILFSHFPVFHDCPYDKQAVFYPAILELERIYDRYSCDLNIHGHTHMKRSRFRNSFNASIDATNMVPISLGSILKKTYGRIECYNQ